jgi:integrase
VIQPSPSQRGTSGSGHHFRRVAQGLFVAEPSGVYYTIFRSGGKLFRGSLKTADEKTALRKLLPTQARLLKRNATLSRATFGEMVKLWKETELASKDLKPWSRIYRENCVKGLYRSWPTLEKTAVRKITTTDCERWLGARRTQISSGLLNNELGTLKMVLGYAVREGAIPNNLAEGLKRTKVSQAHIVIPTRAQFSSIVADLRERGSVAAANFVELLGFSGMRRHEVAELRWKDVDFRAGQFTVTGGEQGTKNRQIRRVPLFPAMRLLLDRIRSERHTKPEDRVMTILECHMSIGRACRRLKLPHMFNHHSLRHFFCSNAIEEGIDFRTIAGWLGHKDGGILVAKTYGHLREEHSDAMAARMKFGTNPTPPAAAPTQKSQ